MSKVREFTLIAELTAFGMALVSVDIGAYMDLMRPCLSLPIWQKSSCLVLTIGVRPCFAFAFSVVSRYSGSRFCVYPWSVSACRPSRAHRPSFRRDRRRARGQRTSSRAVMVQVA